MANRLKTSEWLMGLIACALGLSGFVAMHFARSASTDPLWPLMFWSVGWTLTGLCVLRVPARLLGSRFPRVRWEDASGGSLLAGAGLALILIPFLDARDSAFVMGRLVVSSVGLIFGLGGVMVLHHAFVPRERGDTPFFHFVVALLITLFAAVVGAVAALLALSTPRPWTWWVPLPGAVLLAYLAFNAWRELWRVLRRG